MPAQKPKVKLSHFKVRMADGSDFSDALYANGRHQCEVVVEVLKEVMGKAGSWASVPLTDEECASINIVPVPRSYNRTSVEGWACDTEKNEFDIGLWHRDGEPVDVSIPRIGVSDPQIQSVSRYMRLAEGAALEPQEFMATIVLDGTGVVSSYSEGHDRFVSFVVIAPAEPCTLLSTDLYHYVDYYAYTDSAVEVDIYSWLPRSGLLFVENYGLVDPLNIPSEGTLFQTAYAIQREYKGGILKALPDEGQPFRMNMFQRDLDVQGADKNPIVNRLYATGMYAARVRALMPFLPESDTPKIWRLRDSFGTLHLFKLSAAEGGNRLTLEAVRSRRKPKIFRIFLPSGNESTNELYANGRHQCKVSIEILMVQEDVDLTWAETPLTPQERESITVTLFSPDPNQPLPLGWSCDKEKNIYDTGLWSGPTSQKQDKDPQIQKNAEYVDLYMRFASNVAIEPRRFMAKIVVGDTVYITNLVNDEVDFRSSITIAPVRPYLLRAAQLRQYHDDIYFDPRTNTDIDSYHWTPPSGLRFLVNHGFDRPMSIDHEGNSFQTSFCQSLGGRYRKGGIIFGKNQPSDRIYFIDLHRDLREVAENPYRTLDFNTVDTIMRAAWVSTTRVIVQGDVRTPWRLWDNFGCEHVFWMREDWHRILLQDY